MPQMNGAYFDGKRRKKLSVAHARRYSLTLLPKRLGKPNRTKGRCFTESTIGARFWMGLAESIFTATTGWLWAISTTMGWMIFTSASLRDFRTGSITIAATEHLKM